MRLHQEGERSTESELHEIDLPNVLPAPSSVTFEKSIEWGFRPPGLTKEPLAQMPDYQGHSINARSELADIESRFFDDLLEAEWGEIP